MKVVVVGAGYAGLLAANRLAKKVTSAEITVINPRPDFVERVRLHQQTAGTGTVTTPLASMLGDGITSRVGTVDKIGDGGVTLGDGESIAFDHAFLAVGSTSRPMRGTVPVGAWDGARQARTALAALPAGSTVTVVGGGPTGIETAAEIAGGRPDVLVRLVGSSVAGTFSPGAHQRIRSGLERLKVDIVDDHVTEVDAGVVHLRSGTAFDSDLTLWAIVSAAPDLAARSGLQVDAEGRAVVDRYLRSVDDQRIFVIGDCAAVPGSRFACYTAEPQGMHAVDTLARLLSGRAPRPYSLGYVATSVSLGRKNAVGQFTRLDDTPRRTFVAGRAAAVLKELGSRAAKAIAHSGGSGIVWLPTHPSPRQEAATS